MAYILKGTYMWAPRARGSGWLLCPDCHEVLQRRGRAGFRRVLLHVPPCPRIQAGQAVACMHATGALSPNRASLNGRLAGWCNACRACIGGRRGSLHACRWNSLVFIVPRGHCRSLPIMRGRALIALCAPHNALRVAAFVLRLPAQCGVVDDGGAAAGAGPTIQVKWRGMHAGCGALWCLPAMPAVRLLLAKRRTVTAVTVRLRRLIL